MRESLTSKIRSFLKHPINTPPNEVNVQSNILDTIPDGVLVCDAIEDSLAILYANNAFLKFFELKRMQILGQNVIELYHQYCDADFTSELRHSLSASEPPHLITFNTHNNLSLCLRVSPLCNSEGNVQYLLLTHTDITEIQSQLIEKNHELKSENTALQSSQHNVDSSAIGAMFEQSTENLVLIDDKSDITDINPAALLMFKETRDNMLGQPISAFIKHQSNQELKIPPSLFNHRDELEVSGLSVPLSELPSIQVIGIIRRIKLGASTQTLITLKDVKTFKATEKELQRSQDELQETVRRLNLATVAGGIGIWHWDFESNDLEWDKRMYEIYGVSPESSSNNYDMWKERVHPEDIDNAEQTLARARETLSQFSAEFRIILPNKEIRWIKATADVIFDNDSDTPIAMGGVNLDITKEKNAQDFLRHESEIAQAANEAKSMFLANMSHEIRTPMNGVVGMLSLLNETELNNDQKTMVTTIRDSSLTLLHIINDILDFSKIEAGKMSLESVPTELQMLLERTLDVLFLQADKKLIDINLSYDAKLPKVIMGDSVRLSQVLLNIVGNAVKFTDGYDDIRGRVNIKATLTSDDIAPYVEVVIEDSGIGMTPEQLCRLFNAFSQADSSTTRLFGGTGLGLSITKTLLELMGGDIKVESEFGVGSRFTIHIPYIDVISPPEDNDIKDLQGSRFLFISNDDYVVDCCKANLESHKCTPTFVTSLGRAKSVLDYGEKNQVPYDVLIIGPDFDPNQVTSTLLSSETTKCKTIILTKDVTLANGLNSNQDYILSCSPLKPSQLIKSLAIMNGARSPETSALDAMEASSKPTNKGGSILVVDDQPTNLDVISRQLGHLGYQCQLAKDGKEAIQKWKESHFDLILTDCHMPVMDGYEMTESIRQIERAKESKPHIPIIAITANAVADAADQCLSSGMDGYLSKPVELKTLDSTIQKWLVILPRRELRAEEPETKTQIAAKTDSPICMTTLNNLLGTSEESIIAPLLKNYWDSVSDDVGLIKQAFNEKNKEQIQQLAHAAKGAARSAGAIPIANTFEQIQNTALNTDWNELNQTIDHGKVQLHKLKQYLQENAIIE
ncbi:response regulator [Vibrio profundi]|uniref:PAS domain-containing hybrid sensor histidine kinase/response regulator n=1 Tax=Vibrio profundi TaxID=1774960 RepID=UPI0037358E4A